MSDALNGFRALFPALERWVWLNTPTVPPAARPVLDALRRVETEWEAGEFSWQSWEAEAEATREQITRLVGAPDGTVALSTSMSECAATVAASLPPGKVVVGEREFRSNLAPWLALRRRGFDVTEVPAKDGVVRTEDLAGAVDEATVLLAVSEVQSSNGFRVRLPELAERCRQHGTRLLVNATQSLGALRLDVEELGIDYLACHGYKWLLAPRGAAWLYVRPDRLDEMLPLAPNWHSVPDPYEDYYGEAPLAEDARKLDASWAWFSFAGARAALDLVLSLDRVAVEERCLRLAASFREEASGRGFDLVPEEAPTQIIGVRLPDAGVVRERMKERRVLAAVRGGFLRLGFHAFNDDSDVAAALDALGRP
ncbi:MAG TPA: aminotransferase class V-fold PLP-dependent enzyme [Actinomycetota bacterium]|nr:aminotransferase class V-fold PLP-dependent enzyme [Actinomycetota bacterium]